MTSPTMKILLIEDDPGDRILVERALRKGRQAFSVHHCESLADALGALSGQSFDVALLDLSLPDSFGLGGVQRIREQAADLPLVVLTGLADDQLALEALEKGAQDYLVKGSAVPEVLERTLLYAIQRQQIQTEHRCLLEQMELLAQHDSLTGALNHQAFTTALEQEWRRSERHSFQLSCAMLDIDFFKRINDAHGHAVGDLALKAVTRILKQEIRSSDCVGRLGGEEFCVLLPETGEQAAGLWAERVRNRISGSPVGFDGGEIRLTVSLGVASRRDTHDRPQNMVENADEALLAAKQQGRDRVVSFSGIHAQLQLTANSVWDGVAACDLLPAKSVSIAVDQPVALAIPLMVAHAIDSLAVLNGEGQTVGVLRQADLVAASLVKGRLGGNAMEYMQTRLAVFHPQSTARQVGEFLCRSTVGEVFLGSGNRISALLTRADFFRWLERSGDFQEPASAAQTARLPPLPLPNPLPETTSVR